MNEVIYKKTIEQIIEHFDDIELYKEDLEDIKKLAIQACNTDFGFYGDLAESLGKVVEDYFNKKIKETTRAINSFKIIKEEPIIKED